MCASRLLTALLVCAICLPALAGSAAGQDAQPAAPAPAAGPSGAVGAAFTYQGSLRAGSVPAGGLYDFKFTLHDAETGGSLAGAELLIDNVFVEAGIFTVLLDFGPEPFMGDARWLQVGVRPGDSTDAYTVLSPRHPLTAVPYARYAVRSAWGGLAGVPAGFADGVDDNTLYSAGAGLTLTGATFTADTAYLQRRVSGACPAGQAVRSVGADGSAVCQKLWSPAGNAGTTAGADFLGTTDNAALELKVNGGRALRLEPTTSAPNLIGGSISNTVTSGKYAATIAGGGLPGLYCGDGDDPCFNTVTGNYGTVGGGSANSAVYGATVSGGLDNAAAGSSAAIGGGLDNVASGALATVGGGFANSAGGDGATVPGGEQNDASGAYSFAAGFRAHASAQGSFVWADSTGQDYDPGVVDGFHVRAAGGAMFEMANQSGLIAYNVPDATPGDNGQALMATAYLSRGPDYATVYATNAGTSPAVRASSMGTYSGYFMQDIYVDGNCTGCTVAYVAVNTGGEPLQTGDLVGADGVQAPPAGGGKPVLAVRRATGAAVGVVAGRAVLVESTRDGVTTAGAEKAEGDAAPGDHLFIIVYGLAQVRVDASVAPIAAGQRLAAAGGGAAGGAARALRTVSVEGVAVAEAAPVIGTALEPLSTGEALIWVLVTIR